MSDFFLNIYVFVHLFVFTGVVIEKRIEPLILISLKKSKVLNVFLRKKWTQHKYPTAWARLN